MFRTLKAMILFPLRFARAMKELFSGVRLMREEIDSIRLALGRIEARQTAGAASALEAEFRVYSQWGEDGIIQFLINRLPDIQPAFIEFGVQDYRESNTRFLLINNNWKGLILDASREDIASLQRTELYWRQSLTAVSAFITKENINDLISSAGFQGDIGLLSVDLDGNDYWVWDAITCVHPAIVVAEYNALLGWEAPVAIPYDPTFWRARAHYSQLYYGASLAALHHLARKKGYALVASNSAGNNAFFVRDDLLKNFRALTVQEAFVEPRFREARNPDGSLAYLNVAQARALIREMQFVNVVTGGLDTLGGALERIR